MNRFAPALLLAGLAAFALQACSADVAELEERVGVVAAELNAAATPPGGLQPSQVPQFVSITFDDNFTTEGMDWSTNSFRALKNPNGAGNAATFDGTPVRFTYPCNSTYLGGMKSSWQTALNDGHEVSNHTANHNDGIAYSTVQWDAEISACGSALIGGLSGLNLTGFRSPFLHYDDQLFTSLSNAGYQYDSSITGCWATGENGTNCNWPYTLDTGSPDANAIYTKWSGRNVVSVGAHAGMWEVPVSVVFVPDDSLAATYGFPTGLRQRVQTQLGSAQNPNFYEQSTGKMVGMDITLFLDAKLTKAEILATLKYTLDLRLAGNRAPMVFVGHTHVYSTSWNGNAPGAQSATDRRAVIEEFVAYALTKPQVRLRPMADVVKWMKNPAPLGACTPTSCAAQGKTCGSISDGCGGTLSCGTCSGSQSCTNNVCQSCTPTSCAAQGKTCGSISDGCGGTLSCGTCSAGQTCSATNVCETQSSCTGTVSGYQLGKCDATAVYNGKLYKCISQAAGVNGGSTTCGTPGVYCSSIQPDNAAWGSTAWQLVQTCGGACTPTTCAAQGKNCGSVSDGCGGTLACGTCAGGQTCSANNTCVASCTPTTCAALGKNCGSVGDGCGGTLACGTCAAGQTCSASNTCVASCTPTTCAALSKNCGSVSDGCGGTLACGTCAGGQTCSASNVCQSTGSCTGTISAYTQGKCNATVVYNGKLYQCISQAAGVNGSTSCGTAGVYCSSIQPDNAAWGATAWKLLQTCN